MKKVVLLLVVLGMSSSFGQEMEEIKVTKKNSWFKAGITAGVPVGDVSDFSSVSLGADLRGQYMVTPHFAIGAASGYNHYFGKNGADDFGMVPLALYSRYYFQEKGVFIGGDIGYGYLTNTEESGGIYINPQIGYHNPNWNIYAFYQNTFAENINIRSLGIGATYNIKFK